MTSLRRHAGILCDSFTTASLVVNRTCASAARFEADQKSARLRLYRNDFAIPGSGSSRQFRLTAIIPRLPNQWERELTRRIHLVSMHCKGIA